MKDDKYIEYEDSCSDFAGISVRCVKALTVFRFTSPEGISPIRSNPSDNWKCLTPANKSVNELPGKPSAGASALLIWYQCKPVNPGNWFHDWSFYLFHGGTAIKHFPLKDVAMAIFSAQRKVCYLLLPPSDVSNSTLEEFAGWEQSELTSWKMKVWALFFSSESRASWIFVLAEFLLIVQKSAATVTCFYRDCVIGRTWALSEKRKYTCVLGLSLSLLAFWEMLLCPFQGQNKSVPLYCMVMVSRSIARSALPQWPWSKLVYYVLLSCPLWGV